MNGGAPSVETVKSIKDEFVEVLARSTEVADEVRERQLEVISKLDDAYVAGIYEVFQEKIKENRRFGRSTHFSEEEKEKHIRGILFEDLAKLDVYMMLNKTPEQQELAEQALELFQYPDRYGLSPRLRNPDLTVINVRTREIIGVLDAKLGKLDERAFSQIQTFEDNMRYILDAVKAQKRNHIPGFEKKTFAEVSGISDAVSELVVVPSPRRFFVVPRGSKLDNLFVRTDGDERRVLSPKARDEKIQWLKKEHIRLIPTVFSADEVVEMAQIIRERLKQEYSY